MTITTTAPLPSAVQLLGLFGGSRIDDQVLARPWLREGDKGRWFSRAAWALHTVVDDHANAASGQATCLWVPDYFCNQPLEPVRKLGAKLVFYPLTRTLHPDWDACQRLAARSPPDLFMQVHYFGHEADMAEARRFCDGFGAALIEDAAHVLAPTGSIGEKGDYVLYSQYKHFPLPDGGLLVVRPTPAARSDTARAPSGQPNGSAPSASAWIAKRLLQTIAPWVARRLSPAGRLEFADDPAAQPLSETPILSAFARVLLERTISDIDEIGAARRANDRALRKAFSSASGLSPLFEMPVRDEVPYRAVFRATTPERASSIFDRIRERGSIAESWPDLPPEVRAAPQEHETALALRSTVLTFPIHAAWAPEALVEAYAGVS